MTAVKVCGLTRPQDVAAACELGAAYVGFNFAASSPRKVTLEAARELAAATSSAVLRVGVFVAESLDAVSRAVEAGRLDLAQLHRPLTEEEVAGSPVPVIAVARVERDSFSVPRRDVLVRCHALLFDPSGGTGAAFDPSLLEEASWPVPVLVAGGLTAENVGDAIRRLRPAGVDVATGVELAPGLKDRGKLERFFAAVREADREGP